MREQPSNIVVAVDAELMVLERRVSKLREIKRLARELGDTRLPRAASTAAETPARKSARKQQSPPLSVEDVIDVARDLLADGPTTVGRILEQLGRSRTARSTAAVEAALEQLGATIAGRARGGGNLYALDVEAEADGEDRRDRGELLAKMRELAESAVGWSDEEFHYQLRKRCGIDASLAEIRDARLELNGAAA